MGLKRALATALAASVMAMGPVFVAQDAGPIDAAKLKEIIVNLGYEAKPLNEEAGKEKYEFTVKTDKFDVPIAAELSASKNYVWLTVFLGPGPKADSPKCLALLQKNYKVQPCMFYVTDKGNLMLGVVMENRGITPVVFRRVMTKLSEDVGTTADVWNTDASPSWSRPE